MNRFYDQCRKCSCYIENCDEEEAFDVDSDCTHGERTGGERSCDLFDEEEY